MGRGNAKSPADAAVESYARIQQAGEDLLGPRGWMLLRSYGRLMSGPRTGRYVGALPDDEVSMILETLSAGTAVDVHLMHRHVSGVYESSSLALRGGRLWMLFADRSELA